ncbi:hypothetical protein HRbin18_00042 [bacterium HR18]|nr:hypothetical protein HRbin18_00042 [bacterium HR18]
MREDYHDPDSSRPEESSCPFSDWDELLCEYVDGTMDPAVRQVFEEYLRANPAVAHHVACLCRTRQLLHQHGACMLRAPEGFQARLRQRLAYEMMREQRVLDYVSLPLRGVTVLASAAVILFLVGMYTGTWLYAENVTRPSSTEVAPVVSPAVSSEFVTWKYAWTPRPVLPPRNGAMLSAAWREPAASVPIGLRDTLETLRLVQRSHGAP